MKRIVVIFINLFFWVHGYGQQLQNFEEAGKYGFRDEQGKVVIPARYQNVFDFSNDIARVQLNGKWGCINKSGKTVTSIEYDDIADFASDGFAMIKKYTNTDSIIHFGYINTTGKLTRGLMKFNINNSFEDLSNGYAKIKISNYPIDIDNKRNLSLINSAIDHYPISKYAFPYLWGHISGPPDFNSGPETYYISKSDHGILYRNYEMISLEKVVNPLTKKIIGPINWSRGILDIGGNISESTKLDDPYVVIQYVGSYVNRSITKPFFYNQLEFVKFSENDCDNNCIDDLKTLTVIFNNKIGRREYKNDVNGENLTFYMHDTSIYYYDIILKKVIGHNFLKISLPNELQSLDFSNDSVYSDFDAVRSGDVVTLRFKTDKIFETIESHFNE